MMSWSTSERLLQHREASQGLGMALETYKVRVERAIQPQKSLPESRRVAPGTSLGHFFEARGRHFHEKTSTNMSFHRFVMHFCCRRHFSQFFDRCFIDFPLKKSWKKAMLMFEASCFFLTWRTPKTMHRRMVSSTFHVFQFSEINEKNVIKILQNWYSKNTSKNRAQVIQKYA